jgi:hypothetical protein
LNFHWIGRGKPRKFCQNCRDHQTARYDED